MQPDWWEVRQAGVGTNRYAYSFNDPINLSDRNGNLTYTAQDDQFTWDEGDTVNSVAHSLGFSAARLRRLNQHWRDFSGADRVGTEVIVPRTPRINTGIAAIQRNNDHIFSQEAHYSDFYYGDNDSWFNDGVYKCNLFVALSVSEGFRSYPVRPFKGQPMPALAGEWAGAEISGMMSVPMSEAAFGDIMAWSNEGTVRSFGASGHSAIFMSDVRIVDGQNTYEPGSARWGAIGAASSVGSIYRNGEYLIDAANGRTIRITRYLGSDQ